MVNVGGVSGGGFQPLQPDQTGAEVQHQKAVLNAGIKWLEKEMPSLPANIQAELKPLLEQMEKLHQESPTTSANVDKWKQQAQNVIALTTRGVQDAAATLPGGMGQIFLESFQLTMAKAEA